MANVFDVANYILEVSRNESEDDEYELISHLKLQKLIYFCKGHAFSLLNKSLFPEPIEAWTHGPVCPTLYHTLKIYGSSPITTVADPGKITLDDNEKRLIKMVYDYYGQYSAMKLREITHEEGPWKITPNGNAISDEAMTQYFDSLIEVKPCDMPPITEDEKKECIKILEDMEANGEIDLSQFSVSMGK